MPRQHRGNVQPQLDQDEHDHIGNDDDLGHGYRRVKAPPIAYRVDETSTANTTYVGEAKLGASESEAVWMIYQIDESSGVAIKYADGNDKFDNIWQDRTTLSYS